MLPTIPSLLVAITKVISDKLISILHNISKNDVI